MATATRYIVEYLNGSAWEYVPEAACGEVVLNSGATPSTARILLPDKQWNDQTVFYKGDTVRVLSVETAKVKQTLLFYGFITAWTPYFSGGGVQNPGSEQCAYFAQCPKWAMGKSAVVFGRYCLQRAAYPLTAADWANGPPTPTDTSLYFLNDSLRCIFNEDGKANKAPADNDSLVGEAEFSIPNFGYMNAESWTAKTIIQYLLGSYTDSIASPEYTPPEDPELSASLDHADWGTVLNHVVCEKLNIMEAVEYVAGRIGWEYRLDWYIMPDNSVRMRHVFYKPGFTSLLKRSWTEPVCLHTLYASKDDNLEADLTANRSVISAGNVIEDISPVINYAYIRGGPEIAEITTELVPAWLDSKMGWTVDDDTDAIYYEDSDITTMLEAGTNPNTVTAVARHHIDGSGFATYRNVGRRWALNEVGTYSTTAYGRGAPADLTALISGTTTASLSFWPKTIGKCLTKDGDNHIPYYLEWSADGGDTWHPLHGYAVQLLQDEWGIWINEANLANIKLSSQTTEGTNNAFSGEVEDTTDEKEINYWTSLYRDYEKDRSWTGDAWQTRVRLTATITTDQRLRPSAALYETPDDSGSDFAQVAHYDHAREFEKRTQQTNSRFYGTSDYTVDTTDDATQLTALHDVVDDLNSQLMQSCHFAFPVIHIGDGEGIMRRPRFMPGDGIAEIYDRSVQLQSKNGRHAWITQVTYSPELFETSITLSDLRVARIG